MNQYLNEFLLACIGISATGLITLLITGIKWLASIKKNIDHMVNNGNKRANENRVQFQMLRAQGQAIRATLEVVSDIQNNGNVTDAFKALDESDKTYDNFADELIKSEIGCD